MESRILFNIASRSRPERLVATITNIIINLESDNYLIIVKLDKDDVSARNNWIVAVLSLCSNVQIKWGFSKDKIDAINRDIPEEGWDIIVDVSDDMVFTKKGFDNIIRKHCGKDDYVLFPEPYAKSQALKGKNEMISVMQVMGFDYYMRDRHVYNPAFKSLFCDNFATNLAKSRKRFKEVDVEIFYHAHKAAGYGKGDELLRKTESFWNQDKQTYKGLMERISDFV